MNRSLLFLMNQKMQMIEIRKLKNILNKYNHFNLLANVISFLKVRTKLKYLLLLLSRQLHN